MITDILKPYLEEFGVPLDEKQLEQLEMSDYTKYSLVKAYMDKESNNMRSQGYEMMKQQNGYQG